jgi:hypothetical protein
VPAGDLARASEGSTAGRVLEGRSGAHQPLSVDGAERAYEVFAFHPSPGGQRLARRLPEREALLDEHADGAHEVCERLGDRSRFRFAEACIDDETVERLGHLDRGDRMANRRERHPRRRPPTQLRRFGEEVVPEEPAGAASAEQRSAFDQRPRPLVETRLALAVVPAQQSDEFTVELMGVERSSQGIELVLRHGRIEGRPELGLPRGEQLVEPLERLLKRDPLRHASSSVTAAKDGTPACG